jgi:hypothetical protein
MLAPTIRPLRFPEHDQPVPERQNPIEAEPLSEPFGA